MTPDTSQKTCFASEWLQQVRRTRRKRGCGTDLRPVSGCVARRQPRAFIRGRQELLRGSYGPVVPGARSRRAAVNFVAKGQNIYFRRAAAGAETSRPRQAVGRNFHGQGTQLLTGGGNQYGTDTTGS